MVLGEWDELKGFIIGEYSLNNVRYVDDILLIADSKGKNR